MFEVKLEDLRRKHACEHGYNTLVNALNGGQYSEEELEDHFCDAYLPTEHKDPVPIEYICANNGIDDALWSLTAVKDQHYDLGMFALWLVRQIPNFHSEVCRNAIDVMEKFLQGKESIQSRDAVIKEVSDLRDTFIYPTTENAYDYDAVDAVLLALKRAAPTTDHRIYVLANKVWALSKWDYKLIRKIEDMLLQMCRGTAPWQVTA